MCNNLGQFVSWPFRQCRRPPKDEHKVAELARSYTTEAIETLVHLMRNGKDESARNSRADPSRQWLGQA